ncbi:cohesin subunit SA-2-like [Drosophila innubila]|uniref:cohesin subunit SA-2-like n=1 Tax=Drosophila innubila TaxID=198719 RepID=UPI00148DECE8|nr:cohesin subunit SA-2-like [Drosophila innubila]
MVLVRTQFLELLEQIKDILLEQDNESVLQMGAKTLEHLYGLNDSHEDHRKELLNKVVSNYKSAINVWNQSKDNTGRMLVTLRLLSAIYARFDLHDWQLSDHLLFNLKQATRKKPESTGKCLPDEAVDLYLSIFYVALSWDLKRVQDLAKAGKDVAEDCHSLRNRLRDFFAVNFTLIQTSTDSNVACNAFVYTCDLFVLFSDPLRKSSSSSIQALEYKSKQQDYELLEKYLQRYVFAGSAEGAALQLLEPQQFSMLQSKRRVLVSYLKLIFHNVMPMMRACVAYQYYEQYHPVFGDIMRSTMEHSLAMNPTNFGMTVMHTCLLVYKRIRVTYADSFQAAASTEFAKLLKLANLLAELFHIKQLEVRQGILILHRAGIRFAVEMTLDDPSAAPKDLLYLNVIQQFVPQLLAQDMLDVFNFLKFIDQTRRADEWQPLFSYRNCLEIAIRQSCRREDLNDIFNYTAQ